MVQQRDPLAFWFQMATMWVGMFFYGIYLVLFCICMYHLLRRPLNRPSAIILLVTAVLLFALSTTQEVLNIVLGSGEILGWEIDFEGISLADDVILVGENLIAGGFVVSKTRLLPLRYSSFEIYRCWVVWYRNWIVIVPALAGLVITTVFGWDIDLSLSSFFALTLATDLYITLITAGRIWWIYHTSFLEYQQSKSSFSSDASTHYKSSVAILVESGIIFPILFILRLAVQRPGLVNVITETLRQAMGIIPTLIILRISLGISVDNIPYTPSSAETLSEKGTQISQPLRAGDYTSFVAVSTPTSEKPPHYQRASAVLAPLRRPNTGRSPLGDPERGYGYGYGNGYRYVPQPGSRPAHKVGASASSLGSMAVSLTSMEFAPNDAMLERPRAAPSPVPPALTLAPPVYAGWQPQAQTGGREYYAQ
ncbi:hypothetical protein HMN09_01365300 [Mycena chlorophos]|uniref:Uncharacterized protein n=1 Tax=Mycena chlorophos TaxID=658473 RepID=A0A8H6VUL8_MYCCL|nr:hypothetical protein HMN09_01365300 [Mycena chlorophos]